MYIKRTISKELSEHLSSKEITLLVGPRQVGKTTLMLWLQDQLKAKGENTLFLNLDVESNKIFFNSQNDLIHKIELELGKEKGYVFIDEIQRKENAGLFLKGLYDLNLPYKFIVSGSGSLELKEKIHESLAGRKRVFEITPLSLIEFVNFKTANKYEDKLVDFFNLEKDETQRLLVEYLNFGGYPNVVLADKQLEKEKIIGEIFQSYLEKDISYLLGLKKTDVFIKLVKILSSQAGQLINISELASTLGVSALTVNHYIWYLEKTFIIAKVSPYFKNVRKEITKAPAIYFYDLGLRNYALGNFGNAKDVELGWLFQNLIYQIIKEKIIHQSNKIYFWRTKDGSEVDFIIDDGQAIIPMEVKYSKFKEPLITRSLRAFITKYNPAIAYIVSPQFESKIKLNNTMVFFIPFYKIDSIIEHDVIRR